MDLALVEGSVCLQDEHSIKELLEVREKAGLVVAFGSCAMTGCFTRYSRGGQLAQPKHESFVPISNLVKVDAAIPGCPASPEIIAKTIVALVNGDMDYLTPMLNMAACDLACGCDLQTSVVNKALCCGCGTLFDEELDNEKMDSIYINPFTDYPAEMGFYNYLELFDLIEIEEVECDDPDCDDPSHHH